MPLSNYSVKFIPQHPFDDDVNDVDMVN